MQGIKNEKGPGAELKYPVNVKPRIEIKILTDFVRLQAQFLSEEPNPLKLG